MPTCVCLAWLKYNAFVCTHSSEVTFQSGKLIKNWKQKTSASLETSDKREKSFHTSVSLQRCDRREWGGCISVVRKLNPNIPWPFIERSATGALSPISNRITRQPEISSVLWHMLRPFSLHMRKRVNREGYRTLSSISLIHHSTAKVHCFEVTMQN